MSQSETTSRPRESHRATIAVTLAAIVMLPLIGRWLAGRSIQSYLEFPPMTHSVTHAPFSWPIFSASVLLIIRVEIDLENRVTKIVKVDSTSP